MQCPSRVYIDNLGLVVVNPTLEKVGVSNVYKMLGLLHPLPISFKVGYSIVSKLGLHWKELE